MRPEQLKISYRIIEKLKQKHHVSIDEVWECFLNRKQGFLEDTRLNHQTEPPTFWFISHTDRGRKLKVVFINQHDGYEIKTTYEPNSKEVIIYEKYA